MHPRRLPTLGPDNEPLWVRLYVRQIEETWAAMLVADEALPPGPGELKGMAFFGDTAEEVERLALMYRGEGVPGN